MWGEPLKICAAPYETEVPLEDPDHVFAGVTYQIFRKWNVSHDDVPNMAGFIERQSEKYNATPGDSAFVIKSYSQKKTALLAELAQNFAFFDSYVSCIGLEEKSELMGYSLLSTPVRPTPIANLRLPARLVALWTTRSRRLGSSTTSPGPPAPRRSLSP